MHRGLYWPARRHLFRRDAPPRRWLGWPTIIVLLVALLGAVISVWFSNPDQVAACCRAA